MRKTVVTILILLLSVAASFAQEAAPKDIIVLRNGDRLTGVIVLQTDETVMIQTDDGKRFQFQIGEIERIEQEKIKSNVNKMRPAKTGIALSFLRPAAPMVRPLSLLRRPAERHDPHDESAGSGACPAFSPAQGAAPLQVRLRRTRTHPPCTRRRDLLFRKRLALTAGLPHIERRRVQRLHPCPRNRPTGNVRLLGPGTGRPTIRTRRRYAPLPDYPDAERRSLVGSSPVWRRLGAGQRILRFDATGFRPALESHDGRSAR